MVATSIELEERKGGGGHGSSGGKGSSGSKGSSSSSAAKVNSGTSTSTKGGGGSSGKGSGTLGDRPPSYASLYPSRPGFNAGGRPQGVADTSRAAYQPPPAYSANANYVPLSYGQTLPPYTFASKSPAVYYASTSRSSYPGSWGYGFYPIYPYPFWAYGTGYWVGSTYYPNTYHHGIHNYHSQLRNITVLNGTNIPLIGNQDIFALNNRNITFTDFNNGTIQIAPCGNLTYTDFGVSPSDCDFIVLDIKNGNVVKGNARTEIHDEITFFQLKLGDRTSTLRTQTISSTKKKPQGGPLAGIIVGVIAFVVIVCVALWWFLKRRR
ncbi:hypothetical protein GGI07_005278 [Coemansia sp. Benny D115]|nr:hypothetical protein GGI07_005278 [Coemansia sp. Benny D115]